MALETYELVSLGSPHEVREFDKGKLELFRVCGAVVGRATFEPGWKWSTCIKPIARTESCQAAHFGYQLSGAMKVQMDDGTQLITKAGDFVSIPPGHDGWVIGNEPAVFLDFQGMIDYAKLKK
jgi:hypothetical protein